MSVCTNYLLARWVFFLANIRAFLRGGGQKVIPHLQSVALEQGFQEQKNNNNNNNNKQKNTENVTCNLINSFLRI